MGKYTLTSSSLEVLLIINALATQAMEGEIAQCKRESVQCN